MTKINTYIFLDLETTGFPHEEAYRTQITEISMVAAKREHILAGEVPRVLHKLTLCFRPALKINKKVHEITGLNNDLLKNENIFNSSATVDTIKSFLNLQTPPVCLISHNGCIFDFPILRAEVDRARYELPDDLLCIDSLKMFRFILNNRIGSPSKSPMIDSSPPTPIVSSHDEFDDFEIPIEVLKEIDELEKNNMSGTSNGTPTKKRGRESYKLKDIYERLTGKIASGCHRAENDCMMLLECCTKMSNEFIEWADNHNVLLNSIPKMQAKELLTARFVYS